MSAVGYTAAPSLEAQLDFLTKLQRLFAEGDFSSTYKFALLITLGELAIESRAEGSQELRLSMRSIADRFIGLYWNHARSYGSGKAEAVSGVLTQNRGAQAAVLSAIGDFQATYPGVTLAQLHAHPAHPQLRSTVAITVAQQPVKYLQNLGNGRVPFLYERELGGVVLKPGVAYCLRRFFPLLNQLARSGWLSHIKGNVKNHQILGDADDLEAFLFEPSRGSLAVIGRELGKLDAQTCFYCRGRIHNSADVDHYIPFVLYPRDLAHNFVLAHAACNRSKSHALAGRDHLHRWLERLVAHSADLAQIGRDAGVPINQGVTLNMARWAYQQGMAAEGHAWVAPQKFQAIDSSFLDQGMWIEAS